MFTLICGSPVSPLAGRGEHRQRSPLRQAQGVVVNSALTARYSLLRGKIGPPPTSGR